MCDCQPHADVLSEYQPPLFQRYDLTVEFLRRRRLVKTLLAERWSRLHMIADEEILRELVCVCSIAPLRLDHEHERLLVEDAGVVAETQQPCYLYRKFIPFDGDVELWHLSPGAEEDSSTAGEVAYLEYVTSVLELSEESALPVLNKQTELAERMISAQHARIVTFNRGLPAFVARELAKWRRQDQVSRWWERPVGRA